MQRLLITGAIERPDGFELGDGKYYGAAKLLRLDLESGNIETLLSLEEGNENYPSEHPNLQFTAGQVDRDQLWLPTDTEIRVYSYPELTLNRVISHPFFQNVHSVHLHGDEIVVTCTGLDMVAVLDRDSGACKQLFNVDGKDPWYRHCADTDYRQVHSTRPHDGHPNYVYKWRDQLWVTRCTQEDAVCLPGASQRLNISGDNKTIAVHDGHLINDKVYFTSVDGWILIGDPDQLKVVDSINLNKLDSGKTTRGWCRGIWLDGHRIHVAYSRLRKTRSKSRVSWVKQMVKQRPASACASIVTYDLEARKIVREYSLDEDKIHAIYSLLPEPSSAT